MRNRPGQSDLFKGRHFEQEIIVLCVRWYLRYKLSHRDLAKMMAERGLQIAHATTFAEFSDMHQSSISAGAVSRNRSDIKVVDGALGPSRWAALVAVRLPLY